jgi:hypothetical protein
LQGDILQQEIKNKIKKISFIGAVSKIWFDG